MTEQAKRKKDPKIIAKRVASDAVVYLLLIFGAFLFVLPFFWMLSTSFKEYGEIFSYPISWFPKKWIFSNYKEVFDVTAYVNIPLGFMNTLIIVVPSTTVGCLTAALAAFAFAKIRFPGRDQIFFALICTMAIPGVITMIPSYVIYSRLHWTDTWLPLMVPGMFGGAGAIFFTRQVMLGIPTSLEDAARIDGMNWWKIFWVIELPLSKAVVITNFMFGFLGGYNDYMGPLLYITSKDNLKTLQQMLAMLNDTFGTRWGIQMAGSCIAMIPTVLLFIFAQRYFVEGITLSGIKD